MKKRLYFCFLWNDLEMEPTDSWTEEEARTADAERKPYTVLVGSESSPECAIEVVPQNDYIGVKFLDDRKRNHLQYVYDTKGGGDIFLREIISRNFLRSTNEIVGGTDYLFSRDGAVRITEYDGDVTRTGETSADVSKNYTLNPVFGEYDEIIRKDR